MRFARSALIAAEALLGTGKIVDDRVRIVPVDEGDEVQRAALDIGQVGG